MPRRQRFKPSRKPKQHDERTQAAEPVPLAEPPLPGADEPTWPRPMHFEEKDVEC